MKIKSISVWDLDGTTVDSTHRYSVKNGKLDLDHWKANAHLCKNDTLLPLAKRYKADLKVKSRLTIIATARTLHQDDLDFIEKNMGMPNYIVSRLDDSQDTQQLKIDGIAKIIKDFPDAAITIFEDNIKNLLALTHHFGGLGVYVPSNQGH